MNTNNQFKKAGYVQEPVLSASEVKELRSYILSVFDAYSLPNKKKRYLNASEIIRHEKILLATVNQKIIKILKEILEQHYTIIPDFQVQVNMYGSLIGRSHGWHLDCNSEIPNDYLFDKDYAFVKCGLYLQDNTEELGGGIDMIPGAHRFFIRTGNNKLDFKMKNLFMRLFANYRGQQVPVRAGDFIAFDSRLPHRSTPPSIKLINKMTEEERRTGCLNMSHFLESEAKIVLYFNACRTRYADSFLANSCARAIRQEFEVSEKETFFSNYLQLSYPDDFPSSFVEVISREILEIGTIQDVDFKRRCKDYLLEGESLVA